MCLVMGVARRHFGVLKVHFNLMSRLVELTSVRDPCHTLFVIFESTSLHTAAARIPTIPKAIDAKATTLRTKSVKCSRI